MTDLYRRLTTALSVISGRNEDFAKAWEVMTGLDWETQWPEPSPDDVIEIAELIVRDALANVLGID